MSRRERVNLRELAGLDSSAPSRRLVGSATRFQLGDLNGCCGLPADGQSPAGQSVAILAQHQTNAALMLMELDGLARRVTLCPPGLRIADYRAALGDAQTGLIVTDHDLAPELAASCPTIRYDAGRRSPSGLSVSERHDTQWILFTSGTSGRPKLAVHCLASLLGTRPAGAEAAPGAVWGTFYDVQRYGGLQILLRALVTQGSMVFSSGGAVDAGFLERARAERVTYLSGTPSHWRRALASNEGLIPSLSSIRLSGEPCDQAILNLIRHLYPHARITHAFASTEAGLAFEVTDGLAGFPVSVPGDASSSVDIDVSTGSLRIRSSRCASHYLGQQPVALRDADGFVDTGDLVEPRNGRFYFLGRRGGIINVGGTKIHPEFVESVINQHPAVESSLVRGRKSPITGAILVGDIVIKPGSVATARSSDAIKEEILQFCRVNLPRHHVPAMLEIVPSIGIGPAGKLLRGHA